MGRRKIEIEPIKDDRNRTVTFIKRKAGLFKKAHELSVLCQVDIAVIILGSNNTFYEYSSVDMSNLLNVHQNNTDLPHNIIEPSDYGDYVKKPRVVLNERKRRRRRATVLQPASHSGSCTVSSQDSSSVQNNGNLSAPLASNDAGNAGVSTPLVHCHGAISRSGSNHSDCARNSADYQMLQGGLNSGGSFHANDYKESVDQQHVANEAIHRNFMNKRIRPDTHLLLSESNHSNYHNFYPSPYENLPKPSLPASLVGNIPSFQSQFVQVIPANSNPMGKGFNGTGDSESFEAKQKIHPTVAISNTLEGPAPVQAMVHHLHQLNSNRGKLSGKPYLKLNIPKATNDACQRSPAMYSGTASPKTDVQATPNQMLASNMSSPLSRSKFLGFKNNDMDDLYHNGRCGSTYVNNKIFFLKPPIGRPPKFPKSPSSSIVVFPSSVASPTLKSTSSTNSPD
ncbi:BAF_HP2_G0003730.mRNA.1.CDS.1 [Saccharomyces cerevisiae]|nr:BAF_HP2_G0003730.mRNA.1.CDS.1 [Saccharomyces cerevisiae]CAI6395460.1 BAF_HP1_G0003680.mRNA.1.CDS.1 [Saccharomyces cerevisiae]CAI6401321.1 BAF_HP2_G0003730.mRNA.1.CDS.1 [Saccharomyces cerevisiae]